MMEELGQPEWAMSKPTLLENKIQTEQRKQGGGVGRVEQMGQEERGCERGTRTLELAGSKQAVGQPEQPHRRPTAPGPPSTSAAFSSHLPKQRQFSPKRNLMTAVHVPLSYSAAN